MRCFPVVGIEDLSAVTRSNPLSFQFLVSFSGVDGVVG